MPYHIKKLGPEDLASAQDVFILFKKVFDGATIAAKDLPSETYLKQLLATPSFHIFAAVENSTGDTANDKIVGGLTAYEFAMYLKEEKEAYLYDLAVDETYRRQGIARALIESAKQYARENNIATLFVEANEEDIAAVEFYKSLTGASAEKVMHFNIVP